MQRWNILSKHATTSLLHFMTGLNKSRILNLSTGLWRRLKCCLEKLSLSLVQYCSGAFIRRAQFILVFLVLLITEGIRVRVFIADIVQRVHCIGIIEWEVLKGNLIIWFELVFDVTLIGTKYRVIQVKLQSSETFRVLINRSNYVQLAFKILQGSRSIVSLVLELYSIEKLLYF